MRGDELIDELATPEDEALARGAELGLHSQRKLLTDLMRSEALANGDLARAIQQLTETATRLLRCQRASVWRLLGDPGVDARLECIDLFDTKLDRHESGALLFQADIPAYFAAVSEERAIVAHDARKDPRTAALSDGYLRRLGITAMLDAPVFVRGKMVAVVCHEHVGAPRKWRFWEELLAGTCSDFVALVLEAQGWAAADRALRDERDDLERKVEERTLALRTSEQSLHTLLAVTPVALVLQRLSDQKILFVNPRAMQLFELSPDQLAGLDAAAAWVDPKAQAEFLAATQRGHVDGVEAELRTRRGKTFWARISAQRITFDGVPCYLASCDDISEVKAAEAQLREQATRDVLTGVHNRRSLLQLGTGELDRARRYQRHFSVALFDLDRFKRVNDEHGHAAGDVVLRSAIDVANSLLRQSDVIGRWGGEEFVVLLPETGLAAATAVLDRVRAVIANTIVKLPDGAELQITVSIGVAEWTGIEALESLIERADAACYEAKRTGRNRTVPAVPR